MRGLLKADKKKILRKNTKTGIKVHEIDYAIKLVCQNYKAALTNFKRGHIKRFRLRYWEKNKKIKTMDLEKQSFSKNGIRTSILGSVKAMYNGKQYDFGEIDSDCKLQKNGEKYYLFVPFLIEEETPTKKNNKFISIDLGIRVFGTGITENKVVKIGEGCGDRIKKYLLRKDKIMSNNEIAERVKKKNEKMINKKITNLVDELQWKTINYLTNTTETILIGDISSKGIVKKGGNLNAMTKRIGMCLGFYKFKQRLKYKCDAKKIGFGKVDEWMTSKMCSVCGTINKTLGGKKIFYCTKCGTKIDRDVNGARCIYIKGLKK